MTFSWTALSFYPFLSCFLIFPVEFSFFFGRKILPLLKYQEFPSENSYKQRKNKTNPDFPKNSRHDRPTKPDKNEPRLKKRGP
jgi:hypothetical protein